MIFWDMMQCSLGGYVPNIWKNLLPPLSGRSNSNVGKAIHMSNIGKRVLGQGSKWSNRSKWP
jgi:hypothetical protein